ncbi:hypothetical protein GGI12_002673 [Dipsacomyces acuminosporus]|nr:hypothetical protein GGI12_002673 [Dipsacomyces acuminosporus]
MDDSTPDTALLRDDKQPTELGAPAIQPGKKPIMFYVKPFDGEKFEEAKKRIPAINDEIVSLYMDELRALHKLPDTFTANKLTGYVENLINFRENRTIDLIEEKLRLLRGKHYVATPCVMKREILKKGWSFGINAKELTNELMDYGVTHGVVTLVNQLVNMNKGLTTRGNEWRTMEIYEINGASIKLTALFLRDKYRDAKVAFTKLHRFFAETTAGELVVAQIEVLPAGFKHFRRISEMSTKNESGTLSLTFQDS